MPALTQYVCRHLGQIGWSALTIVAGRHQCFASLQRTWAGFASRPCAPSNTPDASCGRGRLSRAAAGEDGGCAGSSFAYRSQPGSHASGVTQVPGLGLICSHQRVLLGCCRPQSLL